jgi:hypothetical protein
LDKYTIFENEGFVSDVRGDLGGQSKKNTKENFGIRLFATAG